jgi:hypothetical protein
MTVARFLPISPRRRRRLAWAGLVLVALTATAGSVMLLPGGTKPPPETFSSQPADLYRPERPVKLDRRARREIGETLERFVQDGLGRRDPVAAYRLSTPQLRGGISLSDWRRGELPVFPYLAQEGGGRAWTKDYAFGDTVGVEIFLQPAAAERMGPIAFKGAVRRIGGRWLVDSVVPAATFSRDGEKVRVFANVDFQRGDLGAGSGEAKLSASWLLVPAGLLGIAVFVPLGIFAVRVGRAR